MRQAGWSPVRGPLGLNLHTAVHDEHMTLPPQRPPFLAAADPGVTPAGWYTVADGRALWWDGQRWVVVPDQHTGAVVPVQPTTAVTHTPIHTNHVLHAVLTLVTCGFWLPVWIVVAVLNARNTKKQTTTFH